MRTTIDIEDVCWGIARLRMSICYPLPFTTVDGW